MTPVERAELDREILQTLREIQRGQEHEGETRKALYDLTNEVQLLAQRIDRQQSRTDERLAGFDARLMVLERDRDTPTPTSPPRTELAKAPHSTKVVVASIGLSLLSLLAAVLEYASHQLMH